MIGTENEAVPDRPSQQQLDQITSELHATHSDSNINSLGKVILNLPVRFSSPDDIKNWIEKVSRIIRTLSDFGIDYSEEKANFFRRALLFNPTKKYNLESLMTDMIRLRNIGIPIEGEHLKYYKVLFRENGFHFIALLEALHDTGVLYKNKKSKIIYENFLYAFENTSIIPLILHCALEHNLPTKKLIQTFISHREIYFTEAENKSIDALLAAGCYFRNSTEIKILILIKTNQLGFKHALILFDIYKNICGSKNHTEIMRQFDKGLCNHNHMSYIKLYEKGFEFKNIKKNDAYHYIIPMINQGIKVSINDIAFYIATNLSQLYRQQKKSPEKFIKTMVRYVERSLPTVRKKSCFPTPEVIREKVTTLLLMGIAPNFTTYGFYSDLFLQTKKTCVIIAHLKSVNFTHKTEQDSDFINLLSELSKSNSTTVETLFNALMKENINYTDTPYPKIITELINIEDDLLNKVIDLHQLGIFYNEKNRTIYSLILNHANYNHDIKFKESLLALKDAGIIFNNENFMIYLQLLGSLNNIEFMSQLLCKLYTKYNISQKTALKLLSSITRSYTDSNLCAELCLLLYSLGYEYNDETSDTFLALFSNFRKQKEILMILKLLEHMKTPLNNTGQLINYIQYLLGLTPAHPDIQEALDFKQTVILEIISSKNIGLINELLDADISIEDPDNEIFYTTLLSSIRRDKKITIHNIIIKVLSQHSKACSEVNLDSVETIEQKKVIIQQITGVTISGNKAIGLAFNEIKRLNELAHISHGPLNKSYATHRVEQLLNSISDSFLDEIYCSYEPTGNYYIQSVDLTLLLRHSNLSHLELSDCTIIGLDILLTQTLGGDMVSKIEKNINSIQASSSVSWLPQPLRKALYLYSSNDYFMELNRMFRGEDQLPETVVTKNSILCWFIIGSLATVALNRLPSILYDDHILTREKAIIKKIFSHYDSSEVLSHECYAGIVYNALKANIIDQHEFDSVIHIYFEIAPLINSKRQLIRYERNIDTTISNHRCERTYKTLALTSTSCITKVAMKQMLYCYTFFNNAPNLPTIASVSFKPEEQEIILVPGTQILYKPTDIDNEFSASIIMTPDSNILNYWVEHALAHAYKNHLINSYKDINSEDIYDDISVARPNHGLPHTYCVIKLIRPVMNYFRYFAKDERFREFCEQLIMNDTHIIEIAAAFSVTGRESELSYHDDKTRYLAYRHASADNLKNYLLHYIQSPAKKHQKKLVDAVREMGNMDYLPPDNERRFIQIILSLAHNLDLPRCCAPGRSQESISSFDQYVETSDHQHNALFELCCYANKMIEKRGDRLLCKPNRDGTFEIITQDYQSDFGIMSTSLKSLSDAIDTIATPVITPPEEPSSARPFSFT